MDTTTANAVIVILQGPTSTPRARIDPPKPDEYHEYYGRYISRTPAGDFVEMLRRQAEHMVQTFGALTPAQGQFAYEPGKWSVAEVIGHMADTERIFAYRATHMARGDQNELPGMEQDDWMRGAGFAGRPLPDMLREWLVVRAATIALVAGLPADAPLRTGTASGRPFSVRALLYIIPGHTEYHLALHAERYLGAKSWPR